jgi:hypothetical protein
MSFYQVMNAFCPEGENNVRERSERRAGPWRLGRWIELGEGDRAARRHGVKAIAAPLPLTSFADDVASLDRKVERAAGERMKAEVRAHPVDHTPIVTAPTFVLDIIREAIAAVSAR